MRFFYGKISASLLILPFIFPSCNSSVPKKEKEKVETEKAGIPAYDFVHPSHAWMLPDALMEISGIIKLDKDKILAIEDMHPLLYILTLDSGKATILDTFSFKETARDKFDIEDVAMIKDTIYALWSHGALFKISNWKNKPEVKEFRTGLHKDNNTEGLAYDPVTGDLLIACKNNAEVDDEKRSTRAIYEWDVQTATLRAAPFLLIHRKDLDKIGGEKVDFYPSAVAVHPLTHDVYVISTRGNKCIAQFTHNGQLKGFEYLDKELLPQPEGICFDESGNLYISTEGRHGRAATIYEFEKK